MEKHGVTDVVRVCEPTYDKQILETKGIHVHDWPFTDGRFLRRRHLPPRQRSHIPRVLPSGDPPPSNIVGDWLHLVESRFGNFTKDGKTAKDGAATSAIGVHCVAGLGR